MFIYHSRLCGGRWIDLSPSKYSSNDRRINSVKFYIEILRIYSRLCWYLQVFLPDMFLLNTLMVVKELNLIVQFIMDQILSKTSVLLPEFAGHNIPVTKSVMYIDYNKLSDKKLNQRPVGT